jgi:hypothetical protein
MALASRMTLTASAVEPQHVTLIYLRSVTTLKAFRAARIALGGATNPLWLKPNSSAMSKVATGFYAVCKGREIGVFTTWCVP